MSKYPNIGGYHQEEDLAKWPIGSMFESEGRRLYDLVRKESPAKIVEIGALYGCSTTWITQAIIDFNIRCEFISIDIGMNCEPWCMMPDKNRDYVSCWKGDCFDFEVKDIDILFEDGAHTTGFTKRVLERYPAKIVVAHDYLHDSGSGENVRNEFNQVLGEPDEIFLEEPSDCGLAIKWIK